MAGERQIRLEVRAGEQVADEIGPEAARHLIRPGIQCALAHVLARLRERTPMENQRGAADPLEAQHLADEDQMISAVVSIPRLAFEAGGAFPQQRSAAEPRPAFQPRKLVDSTSGESLCELAL